METTQRNATPATDLLARMDALQAALVCNCRVCGNTMHTYWQPALIAGREGMYYHTCKSAGCFMAGQTLNHRDYPTVDLNKYRKTA